MLATLHAVATRRDGFGNGQQLSAAFEQWEGDIVTGMFIERNDFYTLLGITERHYRLTFRFENDRIREIRLTPASDSGTRMSEALEPFLDWAGTRHAGVLDEIYPDGHLVFDGQSAEKWLTLLREWRDARG